MVGRGHRAGAAILRRSAPHRLPARLPHAAEGSGGRGPGKAGRAVLRCCFGRHTAFRDAGWGGVHMHGSQYVRNMQGWNGLRGPCPGPAARRSRRHSLRCCLPFASAKRHRRGSEHLKTAPRKKTVVACRGRGLAERCVPDPHPGLRPGTPPPLPGWSLPGPSLPRSRCANGGISHPAPTVTRGGVGPYHPKHLSGTKWSAAAAEQQQQRRDPKGEGKGEVWHHWELLRRKS